MSGKVQWTWIGCQCSSGCKGASVSGDGSIPDAYFYATAYPAPDGWTGLTPPAGAYWYAEGWTGAVLPYEKLAASDRPQGLLLDYLRTLQAHGAKLMS